MGVVGIIMISVLVVSMTTTLDVTTGVVVMGTDVGVGVGGRPTTQQRKQPIILEHYKVIDQLTIFSAAFVEHVWTSTSSVSMVYWQAEILAASIVHCTSIEVIRTCMY